MKLLKVFIFMVFISITIISLGCSSLSVKDIKDMDPFLRGKTTNLDETIIEDLHHPYLSQEDCRINLLS
ncbi:MAG: hypothetical protein KBE27_06285 [Syntrophorhabdaceae bacterium]|nr:hypothetical protein [Syntrophorhabdaceae bacterium]